MRTRSKPDEAARDPQTTSQIPVPPLATPDHLNGWSYDEKLGYPGEFPYTRGAQPTMYRGRLWTMRQYAGMGDAEESNRRYQYLLEQGTVSAAALHLLSSNPGCDA